MLQAGGAERLSLWCQPGLQQNLLHLLGAVPAPETDTFGSQVGGVCCWELLFPASLKLPSVPVGWQHWNHLSLPKFLRGRAGIGRGLNLGLAFKEGTKRNGAVLRLAAGEILPQSEKGSEVLLFQNTLITPQKKTTPKKSWELGQRKCRFCCTAGKRGKRWFLVVTLPPLIPEKCSWLCLDQG